MTTLAECVELAARVHRHQLDKAGKPYILHCLRVMMQMEDESDMRVAILHDVTEDSLDPVNLAFLSKSEQMALYALTKAKSEDYFQYINRVCGSQQAMRVKLADLTDNMNMSRIKDPTQKDWERLEKYTAAKQQILHYIDSNA